MDAIITVILTGIKTHWATALEKIMKLAKGGFETKEAYHKAEKAEVEARMLTEQEEVNKATLAMYQLDLRVKAERGSINVFIADPNIYVEELNVKRDIVNTVLMNRATQMRMRPPTKGRWESRW